jgi:hypothetical protein
MDSPEALTTTHPPGEAQPEAAAAGLPAQDEPLLVDTAGGRYQVRWDDSAPATPLGQLVFFAQFLNAAELFTRLCADAPLTFGSPNAPRVADVLGTLVLSILAGHSRYAHLNALRFDAVTPPLLGLRKLVSEDSARRALQKVDQLGGRAWQQRHLRAVWEPLLYEPWVLDIDTTVKPIYGHQEGAQVGAQPAQAGPAQPHLPHLLDRPAAAVFGRGGAARQRARRQVRPAGLVGAARFLTPGGLAAPAARRLRLRHRGNAARGRGAGLSLPL